MLLGSPPDMVRGVPPRRPARSHIIPCSTLEKAVAAKHAPCNEKRLAPRPFFIIPEPVQKNKRKPHRELCPVVRLCSHYTGSPLKRQEKLAIINGNLCKEGRSCHEAAESRADRWGRRSGPVPGGPGLFGRPGHRPVAGWLPQSGDLPGGCGPGGELGPGGRGPSGGHRLPGPGPGAHLRHHL